MTFGMQVGVRGWAIGALGRRMACVSRPCVPSFSALRRSHAAAGRRAIYIRACTLHTISVVTAYRIYDQYLVRPQMLFVGRSRVAYD